MNMCLFLSVLVTVFVAVGTNLIPSYSLLFLAKLGCDHYQCSWILSV